MTHRPSDVDPSAHEEVVAMEDSSKTRAAVARGVRDAR